MKQFPNWFFGGVVLFGLLSLGGCKAQVDKGLADAINQNSFQTIKVGSSARPVITSLLIEDGASVTSQRSVKVRLMGTDDVGVEAVYLSEDPTTPSISSADWVVVAGQPTWADVTTHFRLAATLGARTLYGWFKDIDGNVSAPASATINLQQIHN